MSPANRPRVGVDTGGTFTDLLLLRDGALRALKVPSTPEDPSRAVAEGLRRLGAEEAEVVHGSTVGTNALLERRGARTALVTTAGFRDLLEIGRQARPRLYELEPSRSRPLVPRDLRFEIEERTHADGTVARRPDPAELEALGRRLRSRGVEAVAVCLLHSYANPDNERAVARGLAGTGLPVSTSEQVLREYREYERAVTTSVNAYLQPVMQAYLRNLRRVVGGPLRVMRSNGGSLSATAAAGRPVQTILSGPAGGVVGAAWLGRISGEERIITFDMGGTSTDVSLLEAGPRLTSDATVGDLPLRVPVLDIHTVGAGGGSIAWRDDGGALRVGPRSAGADPGPACYGRGGEMTVTDAHLALGRLGADRFLGGEMRLRPEASAAALGRLAAALGVAPAAAAAGILEVARASMERAIRVISLERGHDPSRFVLYCFGGAGGLHLVELARGLGIPRARVPAHPGLFSALGMLGSDVALDLSETVRRPWSRRATEALEPVFRRLEQSGRGALEAEGFSGGGIRLERAADLRYRGQSFEISVPFGDDPPARFHREHERVRGHARPERPLEVVTVRVRAIGLTGSPRLPEREPGGPDASGAVVATRRVDAGEAGEQQVPVHERARLEPGMRIPGPALIVEYSSTVWLPEGSRLEVDRFGSLVVETGA